MANNSPSHAIQRPIAAMREVAWSALIPKCIKVRMGTQFSELAAIPKVDCLALKSMGVEMRIGRRFAT